MKQNKDIITLSAWLVNLYRGYLCICAGVEQQLSGVERHAEAAAAQCLREWRRLPRVVSHAHLPLLRAAQQLMELSEAAQIHTVSMSVGAMRIYCNRYWQYFFRHLVSNIRIFPGKIFASVAY